jgi:hypothetical protein
MSNAADSDDAWQKWFEGVWNDREERVYRNAFGDLGGGVFPATAAHFQRLKQTARHPGWLHHGVFACPPNGSRTHWCYVTSGLSNPWNLEAPMRDPSGHSGTGFELMLCTKERADWAVPVLHHLMAWQLLVATGAVSGQPLAPAQRVPLGGSVDGSKNGAITWALVEAPSHLEPTFELPSGKVEWLLLVGATEKEIEFARATDQKVLVARLQADGIWPLTDVARASAS